MRNSPGLPILVAGGGIGGLTAALCLAQQGFEVRVFEQVATFSEVGMSRPSWNSGMSSTRFR